MLIETAGLSVELPDGWELEIDGGGGDDVRGAPSVRAPRTHIANFAMPAGRGDFGSGAVEVMRRGDSLICLLEEAPDASDSELHSPRGLPELAVDDFSPDAMQRPLPGQSGAQAFFRAAGRAFVLYVVLAEQTDRGAQVADVNRVLASLEFS